MTPLSWLMNRTNTMAESPSFLVKHVMTRTSCLVGNIPLGFLATAQNAIKLPFQSCFLVLKVPTRAINICVGSETLKEFESSLSGIPDLLKTTLKIVGYMMSSFLTASVGMLSPPLNFRLQVAFGLITDEKAEAEQKLKALQARQLREEQEKDVKERVSNLVEALRLRNLSKAATPIQPSEMPAQKNETLTASPADVTEDVEAISPEECETQKNAQTLVNDPLLLTPAEQTITTVAPQPPQEDSSSFIDAEFQRITGEK